jgi:hypothetical protein
MNRLPTLNNLDPNRRIYPQGKDLNNIYTYRHQTHSILRTYSSSHQKRSIIPGPFDGTYHNPRCLSVKLEQATTKPLLETQIIFKTVIDLVEANW